MYEDLQKLAYANPLARAPKKLQHAMFARVGQMAVALSVNK